VPELAALRDVPVVATTSVALTALVAALTAHLVLRWVGLRDPFVPGIVTVVQLSPLEIRSDPVLRAPRCPSCSGLARVALPAPWHEAAA
jgi:bacteriocin biosynthesis cyclodehydratase domain-containing protein